jgi:gliding motility-associated protein GldE
LDTFFNSFKEISFLPITAEFFILLAVALVLLFFAWFSSMSEIAFFSLTPAELDEIKEKNEKNDSKSKAILELREKADKLLATILILNNFVNVAIIIIISYIFSITINFGNALILNFIFQTVIITFILLLFGEIMPKIYATQNALRLVYKIVPVFPFLMKIFSPLSIILVSSTSIIDKRLRKHQKSNISVNELSHALELTGENIKEDKDILVGIINFGSVTAAEAMTPRTNVVDIDIHTDFRDVIGIIAEHGYSRIPVYASSLDDVEGILYIKDLLVHLDKGDDFKWQKLIREAYFVPETKKINDLLEEFQQNKIHMAIVVDEFGGTSGIITMEDVLEEIVGEISDEYDIDNDNHQKLDENTYIFEAQILLVDFFRATQVKAEDFDEITVDADSLAGMILELKGEIPCEKEVIKYKNYTFEIISADERKIEKVKFQINSPKDI